jgi:Holliday junction DNA helicase RuvB
MVQLPSQVGPGMGAENPFVAPPGERERALEVSLRPRTLGEFVGQREVVQNLTLAMRAAQGRGEPLDHVLLSGLPGLGKTTLAHLIAGSGGAALHEAAAPTLQRAADLAGLLTRLERGDVLFIDEIHRLSPAVEEYLYAAMEDFRLDILLDQGPGARSVRIDLPRFTLVGATTREGLLSSPFRGRFGIHERLEPYADDELAQILVRSASLLQVALERDAADWLSSRARGTPRVANRFLRRVRDLAQVEAGNHITLAVAQEGLKRAGVDARGLTRVDRILLLALARAGGLPLGLKSLCAAVGEDERTLEDVYEPHLLREGYVVKTPQGRRLTPRGHALMDPAGTLSRDGQGTLAL